MAGYDINKLIFTGVVFDASQENFADRSGNTVEKTRFKLRVESGNRTELHQFEAIGVMAQQAVSLADHKVLITGKVRSWESNDGHLYSFLNAQTICEAGEPSRSEPTPPKQPNNPTDDEDIPF